MWLTMQFGEVGFVLFLFKSKSYADAFFCYWSGEDFDKAQENVLRFTSHSTV